MEISFFQISRQHCEWLSITYNQLHDKTPLSGNAIFERTSQEAGKF